MVAGTIKHSDQRSLWAIAVEKFMEMADLTDDHNLEIPRNIRLTEKPDSLVIEYSWFKLKYVLILIVAPLCSYVIIESDHINGSFQQMTLPVVAVLLVCGIILYYSLTRLLNTTLITVNLGRIKIEHKPLPLARSAVVNREELTQLYVTRQMRTKRYDFYSATYQINAILANKEVVTVIKGLSDPRQGQFIEQKIEQFLGIKDIAVDGELEKE